MKSQEKRDEQTVDIMRALMIAVVPTFAIAVAAETLGSSAAFYVAVLVLSAFLAFRLFDRARQLSN